jgi:hypothetical protein
MLCHALHRLRVQLVPMKTFTLQQLAQHDGSNPDVPMLISIRGVVFDVSTGKQFYGPNGERPQQQLQQQLVLSSNSRCLPVALAAPAAAAAAVDI